MVAIIHTLFGVVTRAIRSARYSWVILIFSFRVVTGSHHLSVAGSFRIRDQSNARKKSRKRFLAAIMPSKYGATRTLTIRSTAVLNLAATSFLAVTRVRNRVPRVVGDGLRETLMVLVHRNVAGSIPRVATAARSPAITGSHVHLATSPARFVAITRDATDVATSRVRHAHSKIAGRAVPIQGAQCPARRRVTGSRAASDARKN